MFYCQIRCKFQSSHRIFPLFRENCRNIEVAGRTLLHTVNEILDMSKLETGRMEIVPQEYELVSMLADPVQLLSVQAQEKGLKFDGLIVTGAPVEKMDFKDVAYWREIERIMEWARRNVYSSMYICWAAQAAMYYYYGVNKTLKNEKIFGIFRHEVSHRTNPIVRGFDDYFYCCFSCK